MRNKKSVLMTGIVNCECSEGYGHGIAHNGIGLGDASIVVTLNYKQAVKRV